MTARQPDAPPSLHKSFEQAIGEWLRSGNYALPLLNRASQIIKGLEEELARRSDTAAPNFEAALAFLRRDLQIDENGDNASGAAPQPGWETGYCAGIRTAYRALKNAR